MVAPGACGPQLVSCLPPSRPSLEALVPLSTAPVSCLGGTDKGSFERRFGLSLGNGRDSLWCLVFMSSLILLF